MADYSVLLDPKWACPERTPLPGESTAWKRLVEARSRYSMQELKTRYRTAYGEVVAAVLDEARDYACDKFQYLEPPTLFDDKTAEYAAYMEQRKRLYEDSNRHGGYFKRMEAALIEYLDVAFFERITDEYLEAVRQLWTPYFQSKCEMTSSGFIYNAIAGLYWHERLRGGCWSTLDGSYYSYQHYPTPPAQLIRQGYMGNSQLTL